ncbi:DMT family transporter [Mycobacteroides abscessus]|uniref:DMT family transporter n=1 Tax=Mycobacteroides abscessus TaxID=36809 RepID=UPI000925F5A3|nr:DMT family transporter [Mycobacteroides abscessus]MDO3103749.1 DMT family transporter [Mycobacteroides abscessus subsp. abscessus]RIQ99868.1 DMT family transporter [Mycobacteroides abscessus]RIR34694.1 DMT family transporter [Mycobacteroides abscessus]RIR36642.1 DMT family transporter [Mycobacteroides abscessus]RIS42024.1 DMT family transporter [Mycobacteroides abscessus]
MDTATAAPARSRWLPLQFAALALVWGASFLFIKVGLQGLSALQVAAARLDFGALTLVSLLVLLRVPLPREIKVWGHVAVVSLTLCVIPFVLYPWAEQTIDSGLASIYNAATPLMTTLVTLLALRAERPDRTQLLGLALGFLGVCVVLAPWQLIGYGGPVLAQFACLAATLSYGIGFVYMRKYVTPLRLPALTVAGIQVGLGAVLMTAVVALVDPHRIVATPAMVLSMLALGMLGTGLAYVWNTHIINGWGATAASSVTYLTPVIGVLLGALLLGEHIGWHEPLGGAIVIAGIVVSRRGSR